MKYLIFIEINNFKYFEHITHDNIFSEIVINITRFTQKVDMFVTDMNFIETFTSYKCSFYFNDYEYKFFDYYNDN
jgi:hypothetical protein